MNDGYFSKFPTTEYGGKVCTNIMRRVVMSPATSRNASLFYRFVLNEDLREDILAADYYDDPFYSWLIMLSNKIVDPYFGWYISERELGESILTTYGSVSKPQRMVWCWRNNWHESQEEITPSYYSSGLAGHLRKYYDPVFGASNRIISYRRKRVDTTQETNAIYRFKVSTGTLTIGEVVAFKDPSEFALAEVVSYDSVGEWWYIKNLRGTTDEDDPYNLIDGSTFVGDDSGATGTVTDYELVYRPIPLDEQVFWSPVSVYDYHLEKNEVNKNIRLVKSEVAQKVGEDLERLLNG